METWLKLSLLLCVFGCVKEFRPSEPYVTPYLDGYKNFTESEIEVIFSTGTYAQLVELIFVFLLTDLLRYKPVIILDGIFAIITWSLLIWGKTVFEMQVMEVFYTSFIAAEVAYYTYIYAQVDKNHYQKVTSHTRAAFLIGRAVSGIVSQSLVSTETLNNYELNFITLTAEILATIWVLFLPPVKHSIYFYRANNDKQDVTSGIENSEANIKELDDSAHDIDIEESLKSNKNESTTNLYSSESGTRLVTNFINRWKSAYYYLWQDFKAAYTNMYVVKWSLWWSLATCGFLQVLNYIQLIWQIIINEQNIPENELYNGVVEAAYTLIGAATSLGCGWLHLNWQVLGETTLALCSVIQGVLLLSTTLTKSLVVQYLLYVLFGIIHHTMITVANTEVAKHINEDSYGLIFGVNTFVALVFQTILTVVVVDEKGLELDILPQFRVYGGYYVVLGIVFGCMAVYTLSRKEIRKMKLWLPQESPES